MKHKNMKAALSLLIGTTMSFQAHAHEAQGWIVKFKEGSKAYQDKSFTSLGTVTELPVAFGTFATIDADLSEKSLELLKSHPEVEYIEPNFIMSYQPVLADEIKSAIQDVDFSRQWGLQNTGTNSGGFLRRGVAGEDVNAVRAWDITKGSRDLVVAVIDTGVDYTHPDLVPNMWVNEAELNGTPEVDDDGNGYVDDIYGYNFVEKNGDPMDRNGHGTHCAGNIGAAHNQLGIRGVMADVKMVGIKFLSDSGSGTTADAILAVDYATKIGVDIMSNSWGGGGRSEALFEAISRANDAGIVFVAAAGNSRANNDTRDSYPANYELDNVISVGAMDGRGARASFSNFGARSVHVFAPGTDIYSTVPGGRYRGMSGTSMAAPLVSGVVGLLLAQEPGMSPLEVRQRLIDTSADNATSSSAVGGRADAFRALNNTTR